MKKLLLTFVFTATCILGMSSEKKPVRVYMDNAGHFSMQICG